MAVLRKIQCVSIKTVDIFSKVKLTISLLFKLFFIINVFQLYNHFSLSHLNYQLACPIVQSKSQNINHLERVLRHTLNVPLNITFTVYIMYYKQSTVLCRPSWCNHCGRFMVGLRGQVGQFIFQSLMYRIHHIYYYYYYIYYYTLIYKNTLQRLKLSWRRKLVRYLHLNTEITHPET